VSESSLVGAFLVTFFEGLPIMPPAMNRIRQRLAIIRPNLFIVNFFVALTKIGKILESCFPEFKNCFYVYRDTEIYSIYGIFLYIPLSLPPWYRYILTFLGRVPAAFTKIKTQ